MTDQPAKRNESTQNSLISEPAPDESVSQTIPHADLGNTSTVKLTGPLKIVQVPVAGQPGKFVTGLLPVFPPGSPSTGTVDQEGAANPSSVTSGAKPGISSLLSGIKKKLTALVGSVSSNLPLL